MRKKIIAKDGSEVILREPRLNDVKDMLKVINRLAREKRNGVLARKHTLKEERNWLKNCLKEIKKKAKVMVFAEVDGKVMGSCDVNRNMQPKLNHRAHAGIILDKKIRGKGIGTAMMKALINLAKKRMKGLEIINLEVFDYNKAAQVLYKKVGFKKYATLPRTAKEGKKYVDAYYMQLRLK